MRGLTLPAVMSAAVLGGSVAQAALPPTFVVSSTKAALLVAAGQPVSDLVSARTLALVQGVIQTMFLTKMKSIAMGLVALLFLGTGTGLIGYRAVAGEESPAQSLAKQLPRKQEDDPVKLPGKLKGCGWNWSKRVPC